MKKLSQPLADLIATILIRDLKLNAEAASSIHVFDPPQPKEIAIFKKTKS